MYQIEYLNLYDKEGNLLEGRGIRGEKNKNLFGVVIIYIENSNGEFLIQKTTPSRGSIYATTGGHVDYGYTFLDTIIKEVKEELGLDVSKEEIEEVSSYVWGHYYLKNYYLKKDIDLKDIILKKDEVESVNWLSKKQIEDLINNKKFREGNIKGFKDIVNHNKNR